MTVEQAGGHGGFNSLTGTTSPVMAYIEWGSHSHPHTMEFRRTAFPSAPYSAASRRIGLLGWSFQLK